MIELRGTVLPVGVKGYVAPPPLKLLGGLPPPPPLPPSSYAYALDFSLYRSVKD